MSAAEERVSSAPGSVLSSGGIKNTYSYTHSFGRHPLGSAFIWRGFQHNTDVFQFCPLQKQATTLQAFIATPKQCPLIKYLWIRWAKWVLWREKANPPHSSRTRRGHQGASIWDESLTEYKLQCRTRRGHQGASSITLTEYKLQCRCVFILVILHCYTKKYKIKITPI